MVDYNFGGVINANNLFTWISGGTNPGATIDEIGSGLPEATAGQVYRYNGGKKMDLLVRDDDPGFVEGDISQQTLAASATINGTTYINTRITTTGEIEFRDPLTNQTYSVYTGTVGSNSANVASPTQFYIWKNGVEPPANINLTVVSVSQPTSIPYTTLPPPCFCDGTLIDTPTGPRKIEDLAVGDLVNTRSGGAMPIRWIGARRLTAAEIAANDKLRPVILRAGCLGDGIPSRDLRVSRQHRIMLSDARLADLVGSNEALVPAVKLTGLDGVYISDQPEDMTYFHLLLDEHSLLFSEGTWTESLYLGTEFLRNLSPEAREELTLIFPGLLDEGFTYAPAAPLISRRRAVDELLALCKPEPAPDYVS
ncbi:Hint domain-containing protein [Paracoccus aurantiacus]|uniref:Hint domain-containing protein n=1 Tax=Paracoccus aurantiacus TaxID=2599412 RepID=A0A5C6S8I3_9RHOB|nr:Hint domain-containing protein [Paracoccus aurantiacus]TXB70720.1 Hint domain-containing protein [Paracoccus aurantiacus]